MLNPIAYISRLFTKKSENVLGDMVLEKGLQRQLRDITISTARARQHNANYRNVMLYGAWLLPPRLPCAFLFCFLVCLL